jgi:hypothetical protein
MADLTVTKKVTTATTTTAATTSEGPGQEGYPLGQEGRVHATPTPPHPGACTGQEDQSTLPRNTADSGQAGQGKAAGTCSSHGAKHGQEGTPGHVLERLEMPSPPPPLLYDAGRMQRLSDQGAGVHLAG